MMTIFAVLDTEGRMRTVESWSLPMMAALVGSMLVVSLLVIWLAVYFTRHGHSHRRRKHRHHHYPDLSAAGVAEASDAKEDRRRHRHGHRHEHRPRNPTLAETGGLPPKRTETTPTRPPASAAPEI